MIRPQVLKHLPAVLDYPWFSQQTAILWYFQPFIEKKIVGTKRQRIARLSLNIDRYFWLVKMGKSPYLVHLLKCQSLKEAIQNIINLTRKKKNTIFKLNSFNNWNCNICIWNLTVAAEVFVQNWIIKRLCTSRILCF